MSLLEIKNVKKNFGGVEVLKDISLKVDKGEVLGIIGPSGSGKSTLLRCATGLETPDDGEINYDGTFGLVFQNFQFVSTLFGYEEYHRCTASCAKEKKRGSVQRGERAACEDGTC